MARLMLDSNVCIHIIKGDVPEMRHRLARFRLAEVAISSIVEGELWVGVMKSHFRQRSQEALKGFLGFVEVLDWPAGAAALYGQVRAQLEKKGNPIGALDTLIAAHAIYEHATLATRNRREFERVEGLRVEVW